MNISDNYFFLKTLNNVAIMIVRKFMTDLLNYTKKLAEKISYYNAIVDFTDETHWFNPFYTQPEVTVVWVETPEIDEWND